MPLQIRRRSGVVTGFVLAVTALVALFLALLRAQAGGPDAAYAFSEGAGATAADMSGNGNAGTLVNGPVWAAAGRYGYALMFDGVKAGVRLPVSPSLALTTAFTLEAWVRPTADSGLARQIVQMPGANGDGLRLTGDGRPRFRALFPAGSIEVTGPSPLPVNAWTHLSLTYDGALLRLYVDGSQVATQATPSPTIRPAASRGMRIQPADRRRSLGPRSMEAGLRRARRDWVACGATGRTYC